MASYIKNFEEFSKAIKNINSALIGINGFQYMYFCKHDFLIALDNDSPDLEVKEAASWYSKIEHISAIQAIYNQKDYDLRNSLID